MICTHCKSNDLALVKIGDKYSCLEKTVKMCSEYEKTEDLLLTVPRCKSCKTNYKLHESGTKCILTICDDIDSEFNCVICAAGGGVALPFV